MNQKINKINRKSNAVSILRRKIFTSYSFVSHRLNQLIKFKNIKVKRNGKIYIVSGNLNYLYFWNPIWERKTYKILDEFLDSNHSYIDIGAFIGSTVLYGAHLAKKVYAIEPDPIAFKELEKNVDLNPELKKKIEIHQKCIHIRSEKVKFGSMSNGGDSMSSLLFAESETSWHVDGITFNDFVTNNNIKDCNFIKMDIEGGESIILPSMKEYLERNKPVLYLSMHPPFFKNPGEGLKKIIDVLNIYKNVYFDNGKKIQLNDLLTERILKSFYAIVAFDDL